jgi:hypothetical protein
MITAVLDISVERFPDALALRLLSMIRNRVVLWG